MISQILIVNSLRLDVGMVEWEDGLACVHLRQRMRDWRHLG